MSVSVSCLPQYVVFVDGRGPVRYPEKKFGIFIYSVNIKPPRHRFGFNLAWGWQ